MISWNICPVLYNNPVYHITNYTLVCLLWNNPYKAKMRTILYICMRLVGAASAKGAENVIEYMAPNMKSIKSSKEVPSNYTLLTLLWAFAKGMSNEWEITCSLKALNPIRSQLSKLLLIKLSSWISEAIQLCTTTSKISF